MELTVIQPVLKVQRGSILDVRGIKKLHQFCDTSSNKGSAASCSCSLASWLRLLEFELVGLTEMLGLTEVYFTVGSAVNGLLRCATCANPSWASCGTAEVAERRTLHRTEIWMPYSGQGCGKYGNGLRHIQTISTSNLHERYLKIHMVIPLFHPDWSFLLSSSEGQNWPQKQKYHHF